VRHDLEGHIRAYLDATGIGAENKDRPLFRSREGKRQNKAADRQSADLLQAICTMILTMI
jgi:hypothetical protein